MLCRTTTWFALVAIATFCVTPLVADDSASPPTPAPASAVELPPADTSIDPPAEIVIPQPEEIVPQAEGELLEGGRSGLPAGDLNIRAPFTDVHVGNSEGNPRVHVRAPYAEVRVDSQHGIQVDTPIGPIRIGGRGGMNLGDLGNRFGVRVQPEGAVIDPVDALPRRNGVQGAVLGVQLRDEDGIRFSSVRSGSPADRANLAVGDRLVSMNGYVFDSANEVTAEIGRMRPGDQVQLTIERGGKLYRSIATLEARK